MVRASPLAWDLPRSLDMQLCALPRVETHGRRVSPRAFRGQNACQAQDVQHSARGQRQLRGARRAEGWAGGAGAGRARGPRLPSPHAAPRSCSRRLPPWPHAAPRSPASLCLHAWGLGAQAAPKPGPSSVASSAAWRTPLRTRRCGWMHWAVIAKALGLESTTAGHARTHTDPVSQAEVARRPRRVSENDPARPRPAAHSR